jgi:peptidoglycan/xylan/chitin deacetylase (PgdA/CDA1 family)
MKRFLFALLNAAGVIRVIAWLNRRQVSILCYHSVISRPNQRANNPHKLDIPLALLQEHLDYLQRYNHIISLSEFLEARRANRRLPDYSVVLTFDDGTRNFLTVAAPSLIERRIPTTVFVITDKTVDSLPPDDDTFLSWQDIQELSKNGVEFGSHTCSHSRLPELESAAVRRELSESRTAILDHITQEQLALAYPHGQTSPTIERTVRSVGYACAVTTVLGGNDSDSDVFALKRTVIAGDDDLVTFAARVSGLTWWADRVSRFFGQPRKAVTEDILEGWEADQVYAPLSPTHES